MKALVKALSCSTCGGTLVVGPSQRLIRCRYCTSRKLVNLEKIVPRYVAHPLIDDRGAHRLMNDALEKGALLSGLRARVRVNRPRLFFVPFYEVNARRLGRAKIDKTATQVTRSVSPNSGQRTVEKVKTITTEDTKVILAAWDFNWPAVELPSWGVENINTKNIRGLDTVHVDRWDAVAIEKEGTAFEPTVGIDAFRDVAFKTLSGRQSDIKTVEERIEIVFYPVWRGSYSYHGRLYRISIDGLDGRLLWIRGPASRKRSVGRLIAFAAALGASAGAVATTCEAFRVAGAMTGSTAAFLTGGAILSALAAGVFYAEQVASMSDVALPTAAELGT